MDGLAKAAGHEDRHTPLKNYCKGLLLPGERKSIEPMAARLDPGRVQPMRQSLHHLIAKAHWSDEALLDEVRNQVLPAMQKLGPAWPGSSMIPVFQRKADIRWESRANIAARSV